MTVITILPPYLSGIMGTIYSTSNSLSELLSVEVIVPSFLKKTLITPVLSKSTSMRLIKYM